MDEVGDDVDKEVDAVAPQEFGDGDDLGLFGDEGEDEYEGRFLFFLGSI